MAAMTAPAYRLEPMGRGRRFTFDDLSYVALVGQPGVFGDDVCFLWYERDGQAYPFEQVPYDDPRFVAAAGYWLLDLLLPARELPKVYVLVGDRFVRVTQKALLRAGATQRFDPIWCPVANVAEQIPFGTEHVPRRGTKHFAAGAKVYCTGAYYSFRDSVEVVGRHRRSHRYITIFIQTRYLTRWRTELVYSPHVIHEMGYRWDGSLASKERAEAFARSLAQRDPARDPTNPAQEQLPPSLSKESPES